jgi:hypothetical protein
MTVGVPKVDVALDRSYAASDNEMAGRRCNAPGPAQEG